MRIIDRITGRFQRPALADKGFDPLDVWANPEGYTRHTRRAVGYMKPVGIARMKAERAAHNGLPRTARRHVSILVNRATTRRQRRHRARISRAFLRLGMEWA